VADDDGRKVFMEGITALYISCFSEEVKREEIEEIL
jgi:hypothetical protein